MSGPLKDVDLLVIGGSGFVGGNLVSAANSAGYNVAWSWRRSEPPLPATAIELRVEDSDALAACVAETRPSVIVYCAVAPAASNDEQAHHATSVVAVRRLLAGLAESKPCRFIYVSTNAVFSGQDGPYREDVVPDPQKRRDHYRAYAVARAMGEQAALNGWPDTIVVRTADVNGRDVVGALNPRLGYLVEQLLSGREIDRLSTCYMSPTLVDDLVAGLLEISGPDFDYRGILHLAGGQLMSYYDLARLVASRLGADERLVHGDASRTWNSGLDTTYTQSVMNTRFRDVEEQLSAIFS